MAEVSKPHQLAESKFCFKNFWVSILSQLAIVIGLFYFITLFDTGYLIFELASHFQVAFILVFTLFFLIGVFVKNKWLLLTSLFCILLGLYQVLPFYYYQGAKYNGQPLIVVYQYNVQIGNRKVEEVRKQIETYNPDVVLLIETDPEWIDIVSRLKNNYPYSKENATGAFGFIFLSKFKINTVAYAKFKNNYEGVNALLDVNGQNVKFLGLHPPPPINSSALFYRNQILTGVTDLIVQDSETPTIVCGDLNITPWSPNYKTMVSKAKLTSSRYGNGILPSWPARFIYQIPIDHCLYTLHFSTASVEILEDKGSDHLPVLSKLFFK